MTKIIVEALKITGQRGIINKGWGGLGNCEHIVYMTVLFFSLLLILLRYFIEGCYFSVAEPKDYVYLLDNVPHDWLFLQCKAVVSHAT